MRSILPVALALFAAPSIAQVQENSTDAAFFVDGSAADGYAGVAPLETFRTSAHVLRFEGAPGEVYALVLGGVLDPGIALPFGIANVGPSFSTVLVGVIPAAGLDEVPIATPVGLVEGLELGLQSVVTTDGGTEVALSAPEALRVVAPELVCRGRTEDPVCPEVAQIYGLGLAGTASRRFHDPLSLCWSTLGNERFSPDGTHIAWTRSDFANRLFVTEVEGTEVSKPASLGLTVQEDVEGFSWSPDSTRIAYGVDGERVRVYSLASQQSIDVGFPVEDGWRNSLGSWSPDGRYLTINRLHAAEPNVTLVADVTTEETWLAVADPPGGYDVGYPVWSPAENVFAVTHRPDLHPLELTVYDADQKSATIVSGPNEGRVHEFAWAPDGSRLAFSALRTGPLYDLFTVRPDGTDELRITPEQSHGQVGFPTFASFGPAFSPDSSSLLFVSNYPSEGTASELYLSSATPAPGSTPTLLSDAPPAHFVSQYTWSHDGSLAGYLYVSDGVVFVKAARTDGSGDIATAYEGVVGQYAYAWIDDDRMLLRVNAPGDPQDLELRAVDPFGGTELVVSGPHSVQLWRISPDGERVAFSSTGQDFLYIGELADGSVSTANPAEFQSISSFAWRP